MNQLETQTPGPAVSILNQLGNYVASALRFWEPMRIVYNVALGLVVLGHLFALGAEAESRLSIDLGLSLFILAVLANVLYCAAYPIDLFVRVSGLEDHWKWGRVAVLLVGTLFGCVLAHFVLSGEFGAL